MIIRLAFSGLLGLAVVQVAGCSTFPGSGPSAEGIVEQSEAAGKHQYLVIDISSVVLKALEKRIPDSLLLAFGDYRHAADIRIGVGDAVSVTIWEASAGGLFSAPLMSDRFSTGSKSATIPEQIVGRDGSISVPYAGRIRVVGQNADEVQRTIEKALEGKAIQPQAMVNIVRSGSNLVTVSGEVANGARIPLSVNGDRLMDIIAAAGGIRAPVNETFVQLSRSGRTARVSLSRVVKDPRENIYMRPKDVVTLVREPQTFVAYGATGRNAEIPFESDAVTLAEAIARAGGLLDRRADPNGVFVFRHERNKIVSSINEANSSQFPGDTVPVVYRLNLRQPDGFFMAQKFKIFPKDIVYVSNAPFSEAEKAFYALGLIIGNAGGAASIYSVSR